MFRDSSEKQPGTHILAKSCILSPNLLDRMQERGGIVPSVIENVIANGTRSPGATPGTTAISLGEIKVVIGNKLFGIAGKEKVVTVITK